MGTAGVRKRGVAVVALLGVAAFALWGAAPAGAQTVDELRQELEAKRGALQSAEERIKKFREDIQIKKQEARSLEDQIAIIEDNIASLQLSLAQTVAEIEKTEAEINSVQQEIATKETEISHQKEVLADYLRSLYALDQQSGVAVFLKYTTFSEAMTESATYEELQERGQQTLVEIKRLRDELAARETELEQFKKGLESLKSRQESQQATLATARESKENVLELTRDQESEFSRLLAETQRTHQAAEADIRQLDEKIREELRKQGAAKLPSVGTFDWPVQPIFGVSCEFHCAGYPYEYLIGPHSAIDIPTNVGTPILAPADGFVARTHNSGGPGYSYILLLHGDNMSTVYGHVSGFGVGEGQMVTRGTVIGYTGGAPGSRGAGLSSGPHLHFEVRVNNVPVNPRNFL